MRKYEFVLILAVCLWGLLLQMDNRKISELRRCKLSFIGFSVASMAILLSPNYLIRIPELMCFGGSLWYGTRVFAKDIIVLLKTLVQNIFLRENADE